HPVHHVRRHQLLPADRDQGFHRLSAYHRQRLLIPGIDDDTQITDEILDLFPLVKADASVHGVRDAHPAEAFFECTALRVGTIEDREVAIIVMIAQPLFLYGVGYEPAFVIIRHQPYQPDLFAGSIFGPQVFGDLPLVVADDLVGYVQNALRAAVVLLQLDHLHVIIVLLELKNVLDGRSPEAIDALRVVADDADVLMRGAQQFNDLVLRGVRILVLVDKDVFELVLEFVKALRKLLSNSYIFIR